jgi:hypothetical protein
MRPKNTRIKQITKFRAYLVADYLLFAQITMQFGAGVFEFIYRKFIIKSLKEL